VLLLPLLRLHAVTSPHESIGGCHATKLVLVCMVSFIIWILSFSICFVHDTLILLRYLAMVIRYVLVVIVTSVIGFSCRSCCMATSYNGDAFR
jgi:hypothetical protein